jgi:GDPmannose 4,6-dehydratase
LVYKLDKKALIKGITAQDCSYLEKFLLSEQYNVHAISGNGKYFRQKRVDQLLIDPNVLVAKLFLCYDEMFKDGLDLSTVEH